MSDTDPAPDANASATDDTADTAAVPTMSGPPGPPTPWTRPAWLLLTAVGCATAFLAASQPWWTVPNAIVAVRVNGTTVTSGLAGVLPAAVLAASLLGLVVRRLGRRIAGVLAALLGAGAAVVGMLRPRPDRLMVSTPVPSDATFHGTAWPWVYLAAGVLMLAGAALLAVAGPRWPARTAARFERAASDDPAAWWKELDAGADPTATEADGPVVDDATADDVASDDAAADGAPVLGPGGDGAAEGRGEGTGESRGA